MSRRELSPGVRYGRRSSAECSRSRSRSPSRERERRRRYDEREYEREHREFKHKERERHSRWDDYVDDVHGHRIRPGPVVMLNNIVPAARKEDVVKALGTTASFVKDIRLIQNRDGPRNYAFVEFYDTDSAVRWMGSNAGSMDILGSPVRLEYSKQRIRGSEFRERTDWTCFKCGTLNFARRNRCITCDCSRGESDSLHEDRRAGKIPSDSQPEYSTDKNPPSNVLILKGLDALSTEESVRRCIAEISAVFLKDVRLIKDKVTNTSRGFCFVETSSTEDAASLLKAINAQYPAFFVDGRRVNGSYARQNTGPPKPCTNKVAAAAILQAQAMSMATLGAMSSSGHVPPAQESAEPAGYQVSATPSIYQQQPNQSYVQAPSTSSASSPTSVAAPAAAVAESPAPRAETSEQTTNVHQQQTLPSTYLYDSTSGFYYDTLTGLYYDPKTQYHYNSQTSQYCYYDAAKQAYIPVNSDGSAVASSEQKDTPSTTNNSSSSSAPMQTKEKVEKKKKEGEPAVMTTGTVRSAKKIAKDMERWAKNVNAQKAAQQQLLQQLIHQEKAGQDVIISELGNPSLLLRDEPIAQGISFTAAIEDSIEKPPLLTQMAMDVGPPVPTGVDPNPAHTDWKQLACLLCKRKFGSKEQLIKHQQFSDLHKQNLQKEQQSAVQTDAAQELDSDQPQYRDRAKERRDKYGMDAIVPGWKKRLDREIAKEVVRPSSPVMYEQPTKDGIQQDNIGNKMLQAMGWSEGQGLGRSGQGITEPVKATMRQPSAGLGAEGSTYAGVYSTGGNYKESLNMLTRARFQQMFDN